MSPQSLRVRQRTARNRLLMRLPRCPLQWVMHTNCQRRDQSPRSLNADYLRPESALRRSDGCPCLRRCRVQAVITLVTSSNTSGMKRAIESEEKSCRSSSLTQSLIPRSFGSETSSAVTSAGSHRSEGMPAFSEEETAGKTTGRHINKLGIAENMIHRFSL